MAIAGISAGASASLSLLPEPPRPQPQQQQPSPTPAAPPTPPEPAGASPGGGTGVKFELGIQPKQNGPGAVFSTGEEELNGTTTYTGSVRVQQQVGFETPGGKKVGFEANAQTGQQIAFEVVSPPEVGKLTPEQLAKINPFDVRTLPPGVSVKVDISQFVGGEYEAQIRHVVVSEGVKFEKGLTWQAQRSADGKSAQTAVGPYDAVERSFGIGVGAGEFSAQLGRTDSLRTNALVRQKLTIDGDTVTPGNKQLIATNEYVSSSGLKLAAGNLKVELGIGENSGLSTITKNSDGTTNVTATVYYGTAVPLTVNRTFNADGSERMDARTYSYTVKVDANTRQFLHLAMGGSPATASQSTLKTGDTVVLSYTAEQMTRLGQQFDAASNRLPGDTHIFSARESTWVGLDPQMAFAVALVKNGPGVRSDYLFAETLYRVSDAADGTVVTDDHFVQNPGEAWVTNPGAEPQRYTPGPCRVE